MLYAITRKVVTGWISRSKDDIHIYKTEKGALVVPFFCFILVLFCSAVLPDLGLGLAMISSKTFNGAFYNNACFHTEFCCYLIQ